MGLAVATLGGTRATSARVWLPAWGRWHADVALDGEVTLSGATELVCSDLKLQGTILSGGAFKGRSFYRVVAGKGGWGKELRARSYATDAGVKLATVIGDAAAEAGETVAEIAPSERVGPAWAREVGPACRVLEQLAPGAWYIDEAGITRLGRRSAAKLAGVVVTIETVDKARAVVKVASDKIAKLVPGVIVEGVEAVDVEHDVSPNGIRTTLWGKRGASDTSRALASFRAILEQLDPDRAFRGVYEYRVVTLSGKRLNLQPVRVSTGMPDLQRVPVRPGVAGSDNTVALGSRVLVGFVDADPARPAVVAFEDPDGDGFLPAALTIDAETVVRLGLGALPVARATDLAGGIWPIVPSQAKVLV